MRVTRALMWLCRGVVLLAILFVVPAQSVFDSTAAFQNQAFEPLGGTSAVAMADFNGDGFGDLAIGVPGEDRSRFVCEGNSIGSISCTSQPVSDAGAFHVIYGSSGRLTSTGNRVFDQGPLNVGDNDRFGAALAAGHFNGDQFSDLAVAAPGDRDGSGQVVGSVQIFYGSSGGLTTTGTHRIFTNTFSIDVVGPDIPIVLAPNVSLVSGDFNGDGVGDLVIEGIGRNTCSPAVILLRGGTGQFLSTSRSQFFLPDGSCDSALAAADFDEDGADELVLGMPHDGRSPSADFPVLAVSVGVVYVFDGGTSDGVDPEFPRVLSQRPRPQTAAPADQFAEQGDLFGASLAVGDFNGDGRIDLAVGAPGEDVGSSPTTLGVQSAGAVNIFTEGLGFTGTTNSVLITQNTPGVDTAEADDVFGASLGAGDFNNDGFADLAIGAPGETFASNQAGAGAVSVLYGATTGLTTTAGANRPAAQFLHESVSGIGSSIEAGDRFGTSLTVSNFDGDTTAVDLVIGVPFETIVEVGPGSIDGGVTVEFFQDAGAVHALYGSAGATGLSASGSQLWHQNSPGIQDQVRVGDRFGAALH
jgi:hypothetical protein